MKIKLNISKDLKRALKIKAQDHELERNEYIYTVISDLLKKKEAIWLPKIEHILDVAHKDNVSLEEKAKKEMKKTTGRLQPLILDVDKRTYLALAVIAKKQKKSKEDLLIQVLTDLIK